MTNKDPKPENILTFQITLLIALIALFDIENFWTMFEEKISLWPITFPAMLVVILFLHLIVLNFNILIQFKEHIFKLMNDIKKMFENIILLILSPITYSSQRIILNSKALGAMKHLRCKLE